MNPLFDKAFNKIDGLDPYLIWGALTEFRGTLTLPPSGQVLGNERIEFLVECSDAFAKSWGLGDPALAFEAAHAAIAAHRIADGRALGDGIYSATAAISDVFSMFKALGKSVKRIELSTARQAPPDSWTGKPQSGLKKSKQKFGLEIPAAAKAKNVLVVIDDGLAFLNQCFRRANGKTCVAWFWDQSLDKTVSPKNLEGSAASGAAADWLPVYRFGYGRELDARAIDKLINSLDAATCERQVYQRLDYTRVQRDLAHGTQVAGWAFAGHQEDTDIIMVQLPPVVSWDTSGGGTAKHVCDALAYALDRVKSEANVVVNLSFGASAGPHDGSTLLECAIDKVIQAQQKRRNFAMTLPAGNQFNARCHAALTLAAGQSAELDWHIGKGDPTETFCELWYPRGALVSVALTSPLGHTVGPVAVGQSKTDTASSAGQPTCAVIHHKVASSGHELSQVLLAVIPTQPLDANELAAPAGIWKIQIAATGSQAVDIDAWIQRDDGVLQGPYQSRQSYFSSTRSGLKASDVDVATDPVKRAGTGNSIAHGNETIVVGGCYADSHALSNYTAAKPERLVRSWPDFLAPCDANPLFPGLAGQATQSGVKVRMNGTSISAPQVANQVLSIFKKSATPLNTQQIRAALTALRRPPPTPSLSALDDLRKGLGCV